MKTATSTMWKWIAILGISASWMLAQSASADVYLGRDGGLEGTATVDDSVLDSLGAGQKLTPPGQAADHRDFPGHSCHLAISASAAPH